MSTPKATKWVPLESNPEIMTRFAQVLGLPKTWGLSDVFSCEPELLSMVPSPRLAVLFLFPLTPAILAADRTRSASTASASDNKPFFCKQTIGNACGTIALLHAALNADPDLVQLTPKSFFASFRERTLSLSPDQRAAMLQEDSTLDNAHAEFAAQGQTEAPAADSDVDLHFVAFVRHDGKLYELDGRRSEPLLHEQCPADMLLENSCKIIKSQYMDADPNEQRFTILALTPVQD